MRTLILLALALTCIPAVAGIDENDLLMKLASSGHLDRIGLLSSERLNPLARLAPGDPPLLAFRYLEDRRHHRFGELDLMMDDAGH